MDRLARVHRGRIAGMLAGVAAISLLIGLIEAQIDIPNLYLLVVVFCAVTSNPAASPGVPQAPLGRRA